MDMSRYEEALSDFNRAIELDGEDGGTIFSRGMTYRNMSRYEEALLDFNRAIELVGENTGIMASRGMTYLMLHRPDEALTAFQDTLKLNEASRFYYGKSLACLALRQVDTARADLFQAIQLAQRDCDKSIDHHEADFDLALYYLVLRDLKKAKQFYDRALSRETSTRRFSAAMRDLREL